MARSRSPVLAVVGDTAVDYYLELPEQTPPDEKTTAVSGRRLLGGTGANAAAAAAALGSHVILHSVVGDDPYGPWLRRQVAATGVAADRIAVRPGGSTHATILLQGTTRRVIVDRGVADRLDDLDPGELADARLIYACCAPPTLRRLADAGLGPRLVAGVEAWMAEDTDAPAALARTATVVTNEAGRAAFADTLPGHSTVVETRGSAGATIHHPDGTTTHVPAHPVRAVDATGAGDSFAGGLCHYLAAGRDIVQAVTLAAVAAALSTTAVGAQAARPTHRQVLEATGHVSGGAS